MTHPWSALATYCAICGTHLALLAAAACRLVAPFPHRIGCFSHWRRRRVAPRYEGSRLLSPLSPASVFRQRIEKLGHAPCHRRRRLVNTGFTQGSSGNSRVSSAPLGQRANGGGTHRQSKRPLYRGLGGGTGRGRSLSRTDPDPLPLRSGTVVPGLSTLLAPEQVLLFPGLDTYPHEEVVADLTVSQERQRALAALGLRRAAHRGGERPGRGRKVDARRRLPRGDAQR